MLFQDQLKLTINLSGKNNKFILLHELLGKTDTWVIELNGKYFSSLKIYFSFLISPLIYKIISFGSIFWKESYCETLALYLDSSLLAFISLFFVVSGLSPAFLLMPLSIYSPARPASLLPFTTLGFLSYRLQFLLYVFWNRRMYMYLLFLFKC